VHVKSAGYTSDLLVQAKSATETKSAAEIGLPAASGSRPYIALNAVTAIDYLQTSGGGWYF
jgi:hypothetical protein